MFDIGWSELALIGAVALVVIGPKDLPKALKTAGVFVRKARSMAREFQNTVDDMIREAELDDVKKQVQAIGALDIKREIAGAIDPGGEVRAALAPPDMPSLHDPAFLNPAGPEPAILDPAAPEASIPSPMLEPPAPEPSLPQPPLLDATSGEESKIEQAATDRPAAAPVEPVRPSEPITHPPAP